MKIRWESQRDTVFPQFARIRRSCGFAEAPQTAPEGQCSAPPTMIFRKSKPHATSSRFVFFSTNFNLFWEGPVFPTKPYCCCRLISARAGWAPEMGIRFTD